MKKTPALGQGLSSAGCAGGGGPGTCPVNPPTWNWFPSTNARSCCFDAVGALTPHIMSLPNNLPPGFVLPAQPVEREAPPAGADWVHEIKHDGYRMIVRRDGERVRLFSRKAMTGRSGSRPSPRPQQS